MASLQVREERYHEIAEHVVWTLAEKSRESLKNVAIGPSGNVLGFRIELHEIELLDIFRITPGQVEPLKLATSIGRCLERVWDAIPWGKWWSVVRVESIHDDAILVVELRGYTFGPEGGG